tara:strand:- start:7951 stop:10095 length:2145 start_codon:yes stop_codon:yes gene_type:complete
MSNPINLSDLGTLIINEKNLPTRSQFDLLTNKYNQFINTVFLDTFGNLVLWVKPTNIASITTQSSLPGNYIFVKGKSTRQRITFTSSSQLYNNVVSKMISSIQIIVNGIASNLDLTTSGIVIDRLNKTIDFNYTASSLLQHDIIVKLRNTNLLEIGSIISTNYTISVQSSRIIELQFPNIVTTIKNSPHDITDVTVGQTLSMTSTFLDNIHSDIVSTVIVNDGYTNINAVSSISGSTLNYSFTVSNDSDHSGIITLSYGNLENTYSWSANGILTALNDIYTFPNIVSYDGTENGYPLGMHLKVNSSSTLVLSLTDGDHLHSDIYASQISSIQYKTGSSGTLVTVLSSDVSINSATDVETITIENVIATAPDDIYFYVILKGPDGALSSSINMTIPNTALHYWPVPTDWIIYSNFSGYNYTNTGDNSTDNNAAASILRGMVSQNTSKFSLPYRSTYNGMIHTLGSPAEVATINGNTYPRFAGDYSGWGSPWWKLHSTNITWTTMTEVIAFKCNTPFSSWTDNFYFAKQNYSWTLLYSDPVHHNRDSTQYPGYDPVTMNSNGNFYQRNNGAPQDENTVGFQLSLINTGNGILPAAFWLHGEIPMGDYSYVIKVHQIYSNGSGLVSSASATVHCYDGYQWHSSTKAIPPVHSSAHQVNHATFQYQGWSTSTGGVWLAPTWHNTDTTWIGWAQNDDMSIEDQDEIVDHYAGLLVGSSP